MHNVNKIYHLVRKLQHTNRFVSRVPVTELTPLETHFLIELQANPEKRMTELAELLDIQQSSISRIVKNLIAKKLITIKSDKSDSRAKSLKLTLSGIEKIKLNDKFANESYERLSRNLDTAGLRKLDKFYKIIADRYNHSPSRKRSHEYEYRLQQRRITRCLGLLGDTAFGSRFTSAELGILNYLFYSRFAVTPGELSECLAIPQNSVTTILNKFEKLKIVERSKSPGNLKEVIIKLTAQGRTIAKKTEEDFAKKTGNILSDLSEKELAEYVLTMSRFIEGNDELNFYLYPGTIEINVVSGKNNYREERAFMLRELVKRGHEYEVGSSILDSESKIYKITSDGETSAIIELSRLDSKKIVLINCAWTSKLRLNYLAAIIEEIKIANNIQGSIDNFIAFAPLRKLFS